jgi:hypothetical protein
VAVIRAEQKMAVGGNGVESPVRGQLGVLGKPTHQPLRNTAKKKRGGEKKQDTKNGPPRRLVRRPYGNSGWKGPRSGSWWLGFGFG